MQRMLQVPGVIYSNKPSDSSPSGKLLLMLLFDSMNSRVQLTQPASFLVVHGV